jgi:tetratricopeptide (TPR) repeat protein
MMNQPRNEERVVPTVLVPVRQTQIRMQCHRSTSCCFDGGKLLIVSMVLLALQSVSATTTTPSVASISHQSSWASTQRRSFVTRKRSSQQLLLVGSLRGGGANSNEVDEEEETDEDETESDLTESRSSSNEPQAEVSLLSETTNENDADDTVPASVPTVVVNPEMEQEEEESEESSSETETITTNVLEADDTGSDAPVAVATVDEESNGISEYDDDTNNDNNNNDAEEEEEQEDWTEQQQEAILEQASVLRLTGKDLHDQGNFDEAAVSFCAAANLLTPLLTAASIADADDEDLTEEFATCRLHEALCRLKAAQYEQAASACSEVLGLQNDSVAPALRARAFHRRAKAQLELGDAAAALQDARSASFLGDRKAVALYGKLMRESSPGSSASIMSQAGSTSNADNLSASSALLESLMNKSSGGSPSGSMGGSSGGLPFSPLSLLNMGQAAGGAGGQGNLAKSVLLSLSKRIEDESTQDTICQYLQGTSGPQLQQMASMAGMQLQQSHATKLASICNSVTPKTIRRTVKMTKRVVYAVQLIRKILKTIAKYRNILVLIVLLAWIKSAYLRPIPINKRAAKRALKEAAKLATTAM